MSDQLDLHGKIRPGLDILANEIIIALKTRTRFKQNLEICRPGLVVGRPDESLLIYELRRIEQVHAELGRYLFATQETFTDIGPVELIIRRPEPVNLVKNIRTGMGERIIEFYTMWIQKACAPGTDSDTYGESVTADVTALLHMFERINLGKSVAEFKYQKDRDSFAATGGDASAIESMIRNLEREQVVLEVARQLARNYDFPEDQAVEIFQWLIDRTIEVEIQYIRARLLV